MGKRTAVRSQLAATAASSSHHRASGPGCKGVGRRWVTVAKRRGAPAEPSRFGQASRAFQVKARGAGRPTPQTAQSQSRVNVSGCKGKWPWMATASSPSSTSAPSCADIIRAWVRSSDSEGADHRPTLCKGGQATTRCMMLLLGGAHTVSLPRCSEEPQDHARGFRVNGDAACQAARLNVQCPASHLVQKGFTLGKGLDTFRQVGVCGRVLADPFARGG